MNKIKCFYRNSNCLASAIEYAKQKAKEQAALNLERLITRHIKPTDFGKTSWVWNEQEESFTVPDQVFLLINGIYSKELMEVRLIYETYVIGFFTMGNPLDEYFICLPQNCSFSIRATYLGTESKKLKLYEFSITGLAIEPSGRVITNAKFQI